MRVSYLAPNIMTLYLPSEILNSIFLRECIGLTVSNFIVAKCYVTCFKIVQANSSHLGQESIALKCHHNLNLLSGI